MTAEVLIRCEELVKIYRVASLEVMALQGLDLEVTRGEMLGIVGASGSGKSTLMNILGGLDRPTAGRVSVAGQDLLKMSSAALNHFRCTQIGFVWQQGARNLIPYLTALENVRLPITIAAQSWRRERPRAEALLESVGLGERRHHRLAELSGGEQQRVAIAVALANQPVLLLADEPTGEVDTATALGIYQLLKDLNRQSGLTTVIVSHDQAIAEHVDRVVAIRDGKTATETVRRPVDEAASQASPAAYQEYVLLDSAGRLQVPREYLERFDIRGRVHLEAVEQGILIRPAAAPQATGQAPAEGREADLGADSQLRPGLRGWWQRVRRRGSRRDE